MPPYHIVSLQGISETQYLSVTVHIGLFGTTTLFSKV